jgi:hypothetical protein
MQQGEVTSEDVVYFEDMFQPGIESLPYIMDQVPPEQRPRIYVRCLAQAIDPDDFVHVWGMAGWMSTYERMVNHFVTGVLATNEEMVAHMRIAGWTLAKKKCWNALVAAPTFDHLKIVHAAWVLPHVSIKKSNLASSWILLKCMVN